MCGAGGATSIVEPTFFWGKMNSGLYSGRFSHNPIDEENEYGLLQQDEVTVHAFHVCFA
jgi:hypothetical protein